MGDYSLHYSYLGDDIVGDITHDFSYILMIVGDCTNYSYLIMIVGDFTNHHFHLIIIMGDQLFLFDYDHG